MKKAPLLYLLAILSPIISFHCPAQPAKRVEGYMKQVAACGGIDSVLARKGKWKRVEDAYAFPDKTFPRNEYKYVGNRIDSFLALYKQSIPDLSGIEVQWYRSMRGDAYYPGGPVPYSCISLYFEYLCNSNTKKTFVADETANAYYVFVNHYNWFCTKLGDWDYKGEGRKITIFKLPPKVGKWKGRTMYAPLTTAPNARAIVLGHNGKSPWRSLTRKEYLLGLKSYIQEMKDQYGDGGKTDQMKKIDQYIASNNEETLKQPAVVPALNGLSFNGTWEDEENGGSKVIEFSAAYFDKSLPRYAAQFMIVFWGWEDGPVSWRIKKQFEENFPLEKLKALIDK